MFSGDRWPVHACRAHDSHESEEGGIAMTVVRLESGDNLHKALKVFRRKVERSGVLKDLKRKRYYVKPSTQRRLKAQAAERRRRRAHRRGRRR